MASIKKKGNWLYLTFYDPQKRYTRERSLKLRDNEANRRVARKIAKAYKNDLMPADFIDAKVKLIKFSSALDNYLQLKNYRLKTEQIYRRGGWYFLQACGDKFVNEYTDSDYVKLISFFSKKQEVNQSRKMKTGDYRKRNIILSQNSRSIYTRALHSFFNWLIKKGYIKENIIDVIPYGEKVITSIPPDVLKQILDNLNPGYQYALIYFLVNTGVRISTALDLRWEDIDFKNKLITFRNIKVKGKAFTFPLVDKLTKILLTLDVQEKGKIFPYHHNSTVSKFFKKAQEPLGTNYGIHKLKHTFISESIRQGAPLEILSELTNTTYRTLKKHYLNISKKQQAEVLDKLKIGE